MFYHAQLSILNKTARKCGTEKQWWPIYSTILSQPCRIITLFQLHRKINRGSFLLSSSLLGQNSRSLSLTDALIDRFSFLWNLQEKQELISKGHIPKYFPTNHSASASFLYLISFILLPWNHRNLWINSWLWSTMFSRWLVLSLH